MKAPAGHRRGFFHESGVSENPAARAGNEDELCDSIAFKLIYLPELISYIVSSRLGHGS
jgi:hypothetical protein